MRAEALLIAGLIAGCATLDPNSLEYMKRKAAAEERSALIRQKCAKALAESVGSKSSRKTIYLFDNGQIIAVCRQ